MKTIVAAVSLSLAAGPALADHADVTPLYHQLTAGVEALANGESRGAAEFDYAPLYVTVRGNDGRFSGEQGALVADFSYSPLYLQVIMGRNI
jgi:hypothetical protein